MLLLALLLGLAVPLAHPHSAQAATAISITPGPAITKGNDHLGSYLVKYGSPAVTVHAYCVDAIGESPTGLSATSSSATTISATTHAGTLDPSGDAHNDTRSVSSTSVKKIIYILWKYGNTTSNTTAAEVDASLYHYTNAGYVYGTAAGDEWKDYVKDRTNSASQANTVIAGAQAMINDATAHYNDENSPGQPIVQLSDHPGTAAGTVSVSNMTGFEYPSTTTAVQGVLTLTGAVFTDTGLPSRNITGPGGTFDVTTGPSDVAGLEYHVTASLHEDPVTAGPPTTLTLWNTSVGYAQRLASVTPASLNLTSGAENGDPVAAEFDPTLATRVGTQTIDAGDGYADTVTVGLAGDSAAWPTEDDGAGNQAPVPVVVNGTLYGPFTAPPPESDDVPVGAPVLATGTFKATGPGDYSPDVTPAATASGYAVWVWRVVYAEQSFSSRLNLPSDLNVVDHYGIEAETIAASFRVTVTTTVMSPTAGVEDDLQDSVTVSTPDTWLEDSAGDPIPVTLTGYAYFVAGTTAPIQQAAVPDGAVQLGTTSIEADGPGTYMSPAGTITAPNSAGYIVWVWSLDANLQPAEWQGFTVPFQSDFGIPSEMTEVIPPSVATTASSEVGVDMPATDTATVDGFVPTGANLKFDAYLRAVGDAAVCDDTTQVVDGSATLVPVAAGLSTAAVYAAPTYTSSTAGYLLWVATLLDGNNTVLAQGECGDPTETTLVSVPTLSTSATDAASVDGTASDRARVDGLVATGSYLTFSAYAVAAGGPPACASATLAYDGSAAHVAVTAGDNDHVEYPGPSITPASVGSLYWVATLFGPSDDVIAQGTCGDPTETTAVSLPTVTTDATATVLVGLWAHDTATVDGLVPDGSTLTFIAYDHTQGATDPSTDSVICDTSASPVTVASGMNTSAVYAGPDCLMPTDQTHVYWVETLTAPGGVILHRGDYGATGETTSVTTPLPHTGIPVGPILLGTGILLPLGGAGLLVIAWMRKRPSA